MKGFEKNGFSNAKTFNGIVYTCHQLNNLEIGYTSYVNFNNSGFKGYQCHYIAGQEIGCERKNNSQHYYNKPGNRFGEVIAWNQK